MNFVTGMFIGLATLVAGHSAWAAESRTSTEKGDACDAYAAAVVEPGGRAIKRLMRGVDVEESLRTFARRRGHSYVEPPDDRTQVEVSRVDIDGDGVRDFRITRHYSGTGLCHETEFRRGLSGGHVGDPIAYIDGCAWSPEFFRHRGRTYLIAGGPHATEIHEFGAGKPEGQFSVLCTIEDHHPSTGAVMNLCASELCGQFLARAPEIYTNWDEVSAGRALTVPERHALLPRDVESRLFDSYDGAYFVDADNDGVDEIYVRYRGGRGWWLVYSIYKLQDGKYRRVRPRQEIANFESIARASQESFPGGFYSYSGYVPDELTFVRIDGRTYPVTIVQIDVPDLAQAAYPDKLYELTLFEIVNARVEKLAVVWVSTKHTVTIDRGDAP